MTIAELLQLNPQHLDELRSFWAGFNFVDVEIVAKETVEANFLEAITYDYATALRKMKFDGVFRGKNHMHCVFASTTGNTFFCISHAKIGKTEERIIFKLVIK